MKLHDAICKYDPVYVDTDSLIIKKKIVSSDALGDLKLESYVREGIIVKPKFYMLRGDDYDTAKIK